MESQFRLMRLDAAGGFLPAVIVFLLEMSFLPM